MASKRSVWWQKIRRPLEIVVISTFMVVFSVLLVVVILAYVFNVNVPGLRGKTLWDWLQLLIIPAVLAVGGYGFTYTTSKNEQKSTQVRDQTERDITLDDQREAALQAYIDKVSELLLHENLRESTEDAEVRKIARVRTLTVLPRLDNERKRTVLLFLHESGLIDKHKNIVTLSGADLSGANLSDAHLNAANLSDAHLGDANLNGADLSYADLSGANLSAANLIKADLSAATLSDAHLSQADLSRARLFNAKLT